MNDLITVFKMEDISIDTRIKLILKIGEMINYQYCTNLTDPLVQELISILKTKKESVINERKTTSD